jgi:hypothetical protein
MNTGELAVLIGSLGSLLAISQRMLAPGAAFVKQAGEAGDQSLAVRAVYEQNSGIFHALSLF